MERERERKMLLEHSVEKPQVIIRTETWTVAEVVKIHNYNILLLIITVGWVRIFGYLHKLS